MCVCVRVRVCVCVCVCVCVRVRARCNVQRAWCGAWTVCVGKVNHAVILQYVVCVKLVECVIKRYIPV